MIWRVLLTSGGFRGGPTRPWSGPRAIHDFLGPRTLAPRKYFTSLFKINFISKQLLHIQRSTENLRPRAWKPHRDSYTTVCASSSLPLARVVYYRVRGEVPSPCFYPTLMCFTERWSQHMNKRTRRILNTWLRLGLVHGFRIFRSCCAVYGECACVCVSWRVRL